MTINATFADALGKLNNRRQIKAKVRGESESTGWASSIVKNLSKYIATAQHDFEKSNMASNTRIIVENER
jgi:hypothetical protein